MKLLINVLLNKWGVKGMSDGPLLESELTEPGGLCVDDNGDWYVVESGNHKIRKFYLK
jgi:hypothetical protein